MARFLYSKDRGVSKLQFFFHLPGVLRRRAGFIVLLLFSFVHGLPLLQRFLLATRDDLLQAYAYFYAG